MPKFVILLTYTADEPAKNIKEIPPLLIEDYQHFDVPKKSFTNRGKVKMIVRKFMQRIMR